MKPLIKNLVESCLVRVCARAAGGFGVAAVSWVSFLSLGLTAPFALAEVNFVSQDEGQIPLFVFDPLFASNTGSVYGVFEARHTDLVLVQGGFDSGFRAGMVCRVLRGAQEVGEVMLVDVRGHSSAAIIVKLEVGQVISPSDSVRIKTVKF